jgi:hypothetical protein
MIPKKTTIALVVIHWVAVVQNASMQCCLVFESKGIAVHNIILLDDIVYDYRSCAEFR